MKKMFLAIALFTAAFTTVAFADDTSSANGSAVSGQQAPATDSNGSTNSSMSGTGQAAQ